jgi:pimeloyl-ACP methyl ester carboxylesterase
MLALDKRRVGEDACLKITSNVTPLIAIPAILLAVTVGLLLLFRYRYMHFCAMALKQTPWLKGADCEPLTDREDCEFQTKDGVTLRGSYLATPAAERLGVILACHELNGDRWGTLPYFERLLAAGYDVFTFDFRCHGLSQSVEGYTPSAWVTTTDLLDLHAALDYLRSRADVDARSIGLLGVSRGGVIGLCAASTRPEIRAIAVDGVYPRLSLMMHYVKRYMWIFTPLAPAFDRVPHWYFLTMMAWTLRVEGNKRGVRYVATENHFSRVRAPTLLVHGGDDAYIPQAEAEVVRNRLAGKTEFWVAPGMRHNQTIVHETEAYQQRLGDFFARHLAANAAAQSQPLAEEVSDEASAEKILASG